MLSTAAVCPLCDTVSDVTVSIDPKQLVQLDMVYIINNVDPLLTDGRLMVFLMILAVTRMVIWTT